MSQIICITQLSTEEQSNLAQELTFYPVEQKSKFKSKPSFSTEKKPVYAFIKDNDLQARELKGKAKNKLEESKGDPTFLRIPFHHAVKKYATCNDQRPYKRTEIAVKEGMSLRETQKVDANKVIEQLKKERTCTLCLRAGGGKTATSCVISTRLKYLTVVLVQNTTLLPQWAKEYAKFTNAVTHIVDDKTPIPENVDVLICHILRYDLIPRSWRDQVGFLIVDEAPLLCNQPGANALLSFAPRFMLVCTATPSRSRDQMYVVMQAFVGKGEVRNKEARPVDVKRIKTVYQGEKVKGANGRLVWSTYIQSLLYNMERNQQIVNAIAEDVLTERKILVMTTEKKHVMLLFEMLQEIGVEVDWLSGTKKSYSKCQVLVGNIQKCGVGFDDANFCEEFDGERISIVWIVSEIGNEETAEQVIGRARADQPLIRQVVDDDPLSEKHWQLCRKVYVRNGAEVSYETWGALAHGEDDV